jgi:hypothetical protein
MRISMIAAVLALGFALPAAADDRLARFEGGIGVIPNGSENAAGARNTAVRLVPAAGQIWVISRLSADIRSDGRISVDGRGLLLGAGDNVGTTNNQSVRARLFCGAGNGTAFDSATVPLAPDGDFRIDGELTPVVAGDQLPNVCDRPVLLILNGGGAAWFAAGIPKL